MSTATLHAILLGGLLFVVTLPLIGRQAGKDGSALGWTMRCGLVLKLLAAPAQLWVVDRFYNGVADFNLYHDLAVELAKNFPEDLLAPEGGRIVGIRFVAMLTGSLYAIAGVNKLGAFLVFSWLGFLGQYLFYRAFRTGVPEADGLRYARLIFFLPSIVFWPSSIGKDAWMCLALGLAAWGCARALTHQRGGFALAGAGLAAGALVRPHVVLLLFLAASIAYLIRRAPGPNSLEFLTKIAGVVVLLLAGLVLIGSVERFFGVEGAGPGAVHQVLEHTSKASQGQVGEVDTEDGGFGSSFDPSDWRSPWRFPEAFATVLFRPWPFEAANLPALLASLEGLVLFGLLIVSRRRIFAAVRLFRRRSYVVAALTYSVMFAYFFAAIGNFGILSRQKVQVLPFFLVLLALPRPEPKNQPSLPAAKIPSTTRSSS